MSISKIVGDSIFLIWNGREWEETTYANYKEVGKFYFGWCPIEYEHQKCFISKDGRTFPDTFSLSDVSPFNRFGIAFVSDETSTYYFVDKNFKKIKVFGRERFWLIVKTEEFFVVFFKQTYSVITSKYLLPLKVFRADTTELDFEVCKLIEKRIDESFNTPLKFFIFQEFT